MGVAYVGVVTPGIPWSTPVVAAAYCFAKSNQTWHDWIMNHKFFGSFLQNWSRHRVFPFRAKIAMFVSMDISLIVLWITTQNLYLVLGLALVMAGVCAWVFRYPDKPPSDASQD